MSLSSVQWIACGQFALLLGVVWLHYRLRRVEEDR